MLSYRPGFMKPRDEKAMLDLVSQHPFATVITLWDGKPMISHLPLILRQFAGDWYLLGHLARPNPHSQWLLKAPSQAIFHGPQTYVNPGWYETVDVPTWNYAVVHAHFEVEPFTSVEDTVAVLRELSQHITKLGYEPWEMEIPDDLTGERLTHAIMGFRAKVTKWEAKFKLNQNRSVADRNNVVAGLEGRGDDQSRDVAALMRETLRHD